MAIANSAHYCAYLRKSRADRDAELCGEADVLSRHRAMLEEHAERIGIRISRYYQEVVSGDTIQDRPQMQQLLRDVESGMWDGVLVVEVERLARGNTRDQGQVADAFKYSNTRIITPLKTYDPNNEFDEEYFEFGLYMSRREYKTINRRLQRGRAASLMEGKFIGSTAPYGWVKVKIPHQKGYTLEPDPVTSSILQDMYEWADTGVLEADGNYHRLGPEAIARRLDSLGIAPPTGKKWSKASVADILANETNCGYVFFGKHKCVKSSVDGQIETHRVTNPDYLRAKGLHPALIPEDRFKRVNSPRRSNNWNAVPMNRVLQNPLSGIVYCKKCGRMMTRLAPSPRNPCASIKCPNRYCDNISSPLFLVENQILDFLKGWVNAYELNRKTITVIPLSNEISETREQLCKTEADLSVVSGQINRAYDLLEQGIYTVDVFDARLRTLRDKAAQLDRQRADLQSIIQSLDTLRQERELFVPKIHKLLDHYEDNSAEANNRILKEILERVTYQKDEPNRKGRLHNANFMLEIYPRLPLE